MTVTVYTTPNCTGCRLTKRELDKLNLPYDTVDLDTDAESYAYVTEHLGYTAAPVVVVESPTGTEHWSGFRLERIRALI